MKKLVVSNTLYLIIPDMAVSLCFIFCGILLAICETAATERGTQTKLDINVSNTKGKRNILSKFHCFCLLLDENPLSDFVH